MTRLGPRLIRNLFSADAVGLLLVLTALQLFITGLAASLRNINANYFVPISLAALLMGSGLAKRNWKPYQAAAGIAAAGLVGVWVIGARLAVPLIQLIRAAASTLLLGVPAIRTRSAFDAVPLMEAWSAIVRASAALVSRFQTWFMGRLGEDARVNDPLIRYVIWLWGLWLLAAWMGWFTAQRKAILALLPSSLLLAFVISYSERRVELMWGLVLVMLLLMGVWNYRGHVHQWQSRRIDYADSIRFDSTQAVLLLAVLIGAAAFFAPSISWRTLREYWRPRNENPVAEALGVQPQPVRPASAPTQNPALPREHLLSSGAANSEQLVMTIRTGELPPIWDSSDAQNVPRHYWRSVIYDEYVGAGWVTSSAPRQRYEANTPLIPGLLNGYRPLHLDVQLAAPEGRLFWSGTLYSADIPLTVEWRVRLNPNLFADQSALIQADMFAAVTSATSYTAEAYIPIVTEQALRLAPADYPDAIRTRYLQLPRNTPDRVLKLARDITDGLSNPYDRAKAIETYLRSNYPYDLEVPPPPPGQDVADYFLFDLKKGYCDYYATAMVVLARASGVPARFISGYAPASYDAPNAQYVIRELDAHSWVEVYFPEIGWVEFEPTAAFAEIARETAASSPFPAAQTNTTPSRLLTRFRLEKLAYLLLPCIAVLIAVLLYFTWIERWWYMRLSPAMAVERMYQRLFRLGRPLAGTRTRAETSHEFAEKLITAMNAGRPGSRFKSFYFDAQNEIHALTDLYHTALFRDIAIQHQDAQLAWRTWNQLRRQLWFARLCMSLRRLRRDGIEIPNRSPHDRVPS